MIDVAGNIERLRERVAAAAARAGRTVEEVRVIAVAKTKSAEMIRAAWTAGLRDVGENYVQEAEAKIIALADLPLTWHLIGHLQRNKAKRAVERFNVLQTIDSIALARALEGHAANAQRVLSILIEVNISGEASKSGVAPQETVNLIESLGAFRHLSIDGLMTVPAPATAAQTGRQAFRALRELRDRLQAAAPANAPLHQLSMGMTGDFEVAIEEGATMIRVGRAIFGDRNT